MPRERNVSSLQNGRKQPALNDTFSESNKLEHLLTEQKILKSITTILDKIFGTK